MPGHAGRAATSLALARSLGVQCCARPGRVEAWVGVNTKPPGARALGTARSPAHARGPARTRLGVPLHTAGAPGPGPGHRGTPILRGTSGRVSTPVLTQRNYTDYNLA